jgi:hypothetical protein
MYDRLNIGYNPEHQLATCRPKGLIDGKFTGLLLDFLLAVEEDPSQHPFNRLLDLSAIDGVFLTEREVADYSTARRGATAQLPPFRTAIVAPGPLANAMGRIYEIFMQGSKIEVSVFWEPRPAADWLGVPIDVVAVKPNGSG